MTMLSDAPAPAKRTAPKRKARPAPVKLSIAGYTYEVRPIPIDPSIGYLAFEVHKIDPNVMYHVHHDVHGETVCDCPDWTFRRAGTGVGCKHITALVARRLLPSPAVAEGPTSDPVPARLASDDESCIDLTGFASRRHATEGDDVHMGQVGRWVPVTAYASVFRPDTPPDRIEYPRADRARRFQPSPDEAAEAAQLWADLAAGQAEHYRRELAAAL